MDCDRIKYMNRRLRQADCSHSAYKMMPVWKGLFGVAWVCTQCGIIKQELEVDK